MLDDHTKNAYAYNFQSGVRQLVTTVPDDNVIEVGNGTRVLEVAIPEYPELAVPPITVLLPPKVDGKSIKIINKSATGEDYNDRYVLSIAEKIDGVIVPLSLPELGNDVRNVVDLTVESGVWVSTGRAINDSVNLLWNMTKPGGIEAYGTIGPTFPLIYKDNYRQVEPFIDLLIISGPENVESKELAVVLPQGIENANRLMTVSVNLTGTAKHTLDIWTQYEEDEEHPPPDPLGSPTGVYYSDVPNGLYTVRAIGSVTYQLVAWLVVGYLPPEIP